MSSSYRSATYRLVHERARFCCEYCRTDMNNIGQAMHIDHIDPAGSDELDNLCLSCPSCNLSKTTVTIAADPETQRPVSLFNPRIQRWEDHFSWIDSGIRLAGLTPEGRATVVRLRMNQPRIIRARQRWIAAGFHPPTDR